MTYSKFVSFLWLMITIRIMMTHNWTDRSNNLNLAEVSLFLIREHLSNLTQSVVIAEHSKLTESIDTNAMLFDYILQNLHGRIKVQLYMSDYSDQPLEYYFFIVDSLKAFKEIYHSFSYNLYERHYRFLILLTRYTVDFRFVMEEIFQLCYQYDVIDANIITDHPTEGVCMFTYFLYSETVCRGCLPIRLFKFNDGIEHFKRLFPEKLTNFHGCPFNITTRILPPFFTFVGNTSDPKPVGAWDNLSGIEGMLIKILANTLNFKIVLRPFPEERSYVDGNNTYGCFNELKNRKVDIAVGGFVGSNPNRWIFSQTSPYHNAPYMYVVRGRRNLSALGRLAKPFSYQVWILLTLFLILSVIFLMYLNFIKLNVREFILGEENHDPVTNFLALFLGYPVCRTPHRNFARYIFLQLLLLTLVLRNAYQGSLYDAFRMDRFARIPSGYDDLIKWNYTMLLSPELTQLKLFSAQRSIQINDDGYEPRLELLERLEGNYATVVIQDGYVYYIEKTLRNGSELFLIPESVYSYQFVMFLPKHSIYLNIFNKKLKEFACAGILGKIHSNFTSDPYLLSKLMENPKKVALSNKRLLALYGIYAVLIIISLIVFGLELLSVWYRKLQRIFVWIT